MQASITAELTVKSTRLSDLWATPGMLKRTLVAVGVQVFGQFSGINGKCFLSVRQSYAENSIPVINYFGPSMYTALGLSHGQSLLVQGIYGAVGPIANFMYAMNMHFHLSADQTLAYQIHNHYPGYCW